MGQIYINNQQGGQCGHQRNKSSTARTIATNKYKAITDSKITLWCIKKKRSIGKGTEIRDIEIVWGEVASEQCLRTIVNGENVEGN